MLAAHRKVEAVFIIEIDRSLKVERESRGESCGNWELIKISQTQHQIFGFSISVNKSFSSRKSPFKLPKVQRKNHAILPHQSSG